MSFNTLGAFYLLLLLPVFYYLKNRDEVSLFKLSPQMQKKIVLNSFSKKRESLFLLLCFILMVVALARPIYYKSKNETTQINVDMAIAFDISKSMMVKDIHPNRFEFAKNKFISMLDMFSGERISLFAFSNQPFIISPLTNNYDVLKFLIENLKLENINQSGTDISKLLDGVNGLIKKEKKPLIIFTDGSENRDFTKEIDLANKYGITVFIYNIATKHGGVIDEDGNLVKDKDGNIVVSKINEKIKELSDQSDGEYLYYSLQKDDLKSVIEYIKGEFNIDEDMDKNSQDKTELFYIPLLLAFVFLILARLDLRFKK